MDLVTVQFNYSGGPNYALLLDVMKFSAKKNIPGIAFHGEKNYEKAKHRFVEIRIPAPHNKTNRPKNFNYNDVKLRYWVDYLKNNPDKDIIFCDCDMMLVGNPEKAFNYDFDVAFTQRTNRGFRERIPMNGGIMFARGTQNAIKFFTEMQRINSLMLKDEKLHNEYRRIYAGMNQSAFGYVYEKYLEKIKIHEFKTLQWNAVDCDWGNINVKNISEIIFIHYKSKLRKLILRNPPVRPAICGEMSYVVSLWQSMKLDMMRSRRVQAQKKLKLSRMR